MSSKEELRSWEFGTAIFGSLAWMLLLTTSNEIRELGVPDLYKFVSGYVLGFIIAFAGFMFWEILRGKAHQFLDDSPYFRWISYIMLVVIIFLGGISLLAQIIGNTNWAYNVGSVLGGLVIGVGVIPTAQKF